MYLHKTPWWLRLFYPRLSWAGDSHHSDNPCLYLTFDDGPIPEVTPWVLRVLEEFGAKATFFCVGDNVEKHPAVFKEIIEKGHKVANHTFHHVNGWKKDAAGYLEEVEACQEAMQVHGQPAPFFRPPYGKISREQIRGLLPKYKIVMWDVLSADYDNELQPDKCLSASVKSTRPGTIIVFHDSLKARRNLEFVLPRYLSHFQSLGYCFKTL